MKKPLFALALLAAFSNAQAQTPAPQTLSRFVGIGVTGGGDKLVTVSYTNGDDFDIKAGGGVVFTAGLDYQVNPQFSVQGSLNFHVDDQTAKNGSTKFQRFPVEGVVFYHPGNQWKVGAGLRYVAAPRLNGHGAGNVGTYKFKSTVSALLEAEYMFDQRMSVKVRYVNEKFELKNGFGEVDANHVGVSGNFYF
jgi:hypothetical protein